MKTELKEIRVGQKILMSNGEVDFVDDFDGSFYFLKESGEPIFPYTVVEVIIED